MHYSKLILVDESESDKPSQIINGGICDALIERIVDACKGTSVNNKTLNESQVNEIAGYMIYLEKTYFMDTRHLRLSGDLYKSFIENMPVMFYDAYIDARYNQCYPDIMNPMFYFYLFWVKDPAEASFEFLNIIQDIWKEFSNE